MSVFSGPDAAQPVTCDVILLSNGHLWRPLSNMYCKKPNKTLNVVREYTEYTDSMYLACIVLILTFLLG